MSIEDKNVTIVGGGVAGLATAAGLARTGATVTVHERAPVISEVGAGLQISANGVRALAALGLEDDLRKVAVQSRGVRLFDGLSGRFILHIEPRGLTFFVHRARLIELLEAGADGAGAQIITGSELTAQTAEGDLIVGADGVRSSFREALNPGAEPAYSGQVAWRAVINDPDPEPYSDVYLGPGRHLVTYPLSGGLRNIVACEDRPDWTAEGWAIEDRPIALRAAFARFPTYVQDWLARIDKVFLWGLHLHPVARRWHDQSRVLVGDAAHPTLPYLAQGANLALEDAVVLARALKLDTLDAYEAHRRARSERVVAAARANAWRFHLSNPIVRQCGFAGLKLREALRPGYSSRAMGWVWDYDAMTVSI